MVRRGKRRRKTAAKERAKVAELERLLRGPERIMPMEVGRVEGFKFHRLPALTMEEVQIAMARARLRAIKPLVPPSAGSDPCAISPTSEKTLKVKLPGRR